MRSSLLPGATRQTRRGSPRVGAAGQVVRRGAGLLWLVGVLAACGGGGTPGADSLAVRPDTAAPVVSTDRATPPDSGGDGCPEWGLWQRCSVEERLDRAGVVLTRREGPVSHDFLSVPGAVYENARVELQVFLFPSAEARERETSQLDTVAVAPPTQRIVWRWPATLVTSGNMAAIILSLNERSVERIALALGAGLPAAPPR